jgi:transposase-like protein
LSVISAVTLSPTRRQIGLPFQIHEENIRTASAVAFVKQLRRQLGRPLIVVWDRWPVHRAAAKQIERSRTKSIEFEWLPAYAPELNPVEPRWSHTKFGQLANFVPDDTPQLKRSVRSALKNQSREHTLKRSFFKSARLNL